MEGGNGINPFPPSHRVCSRLGAGRELLQREGVLGADDNRTGSALVAAIVADESLLGLELLAVVAGAQVDLAPEEAFGAGLQLQVVSAIGGATSDYVAAHVAGVVLLVVSIAEALKARRGVVAVHLLLAARAHVAREEVLRLGVDEPPGVVRVVLEDVERVRSPVLAGGGAAAAGAAVVAVAVVALTFAGHAARTASVRAAASAAFVAGRRDGRVGTAAGEGGAGDDGGCEESDERGVVERLHGV